MKQLKRGRGEKRGGGQSGEERRRVTKEEKVRHRQCLAPHGDFGEKELPGISVCCVDPGFLPVLGMVAFCFLIGVDEGGDNVDKEANVCFIPESIPRL